MLRDFVVDLSIDYSEKNGRLELILETEDTGADPLAVAEAEDGLSVAVVRGTAETIEHRRENGRSRIALTIRTS